MTTYEVIKKLIGPINPVGSTQTDELRLGNLEEMIEVVDTLISDIMWVSRYKDQEAYSVRCAGERADKFLRTLRDELNEHVIDEEV